MRSFFGVVVMAGAMAAPGLATAQDQQSKPAPPPRAERSAPPARSGGGGGDRAVPRMTPSPRTESSRPAPQPSSRAGSSTSGRSGGDQTRERTAPPPDRRGSGGGERAVPRGSGRSGGDPHAASPVDRSDRNRGDRPSFGTAVDRRRPPRPGGGYYPGWNSWYYPYYPMTYGFFWDPWWYGSPFGGYPYGYGYGGGYGYGYGGGYGAYQGPAYQAYGGIRLKVKPREAEVFVDGYFAGVVDDFDGAFQQLNLDVGPHRIELRHPGYEPVSFEIRTQPDEKITYKAELKRTP